MFSNDVPILVLGDVPASLFYGKSLFLMGKSTIDGPFSIAMLVYQRVYIYICITLIISYSIMIYNYITLDITLVMGYRSCLFIYNCEWPFTVALRKKQNRLPGVRHFRDPQAEQVPGVLFGSWIKW